MSNRAFLRPLFRSLRERVRLGANELRCDAGRWDVLIRSNGEALFARRCESEEHARYCANGLKQNELKTGAIEDSH